MKINNKLILGTANFLHPYGIFIYKEVNYLHSSATKFFMILTIFNKNLFFNPGYIGKEIELSECFTELVNSLFSNLNLFL